MSENRHGHLQEDRYKNGPKPVLLLPNSHSEKSRYHVIQYSQSNGEADCVPPVGYTLVQLGQNLNLQFGNQSVIDSREENDTDVHLNYQSGNEVDLFTGNKSLSNTNVLQKKQSAGITGLDNQSTLAVKTCYSDNQSVSRIGPHPRSLSVNNTSLYSEKEIVDNIVHHLDNQSVGFTSKYAEAQYGRSAIQYTQNQSGGSADIQHGLEQKPHIEQKELPSIVVGCRGFPASSLGKMFQDVGIVGQARKQAIKKAKLQKDAPAGCGLEGMPVAGSLPLMGEESELLLCSERFTSPTPPSDDCGWTHSGAAVIWTQSGNFSQETAFINPGKSLLNNAVNSHGPLSIEQFHSKIGIGDKGELLKAALLGETTHCDKKTETEYIKRDINSNVQSKCADDNLKFTGNDVDSGWRMSGSNGYDTNRMTGSSTGGNPNNISRLSDGSNSQVHTQPQVATAEGMLLGRVGGTGGVALHDIGSRSIVAGTAGTASPHVTLASVFRPPQSVPESGRYGTAFTTTAGSSAVGPYSALYATGSHGAGLAPYNAFYSQYPGYSTGVMHGTLDPQFGSYSAVLQSMGSHAAQSQVPRSPYGSGAGTGAANVIGQYSHHVPRTTSPGGKTFVTNTNISTHERDDSKYRRDIELEKRRYSTGVIKEEKPHHFSVPSGFTEPVRPSFSSTLRESPSQSHDQQDYYKIPSGREGSLKHRILRPSDSTSSVPLGNPQHSAFINTDEPLAKRTKSESLGVDKEFCRQSSRVPESGQSNINTSQEGTPHLHYPPHFMKGSIIQLGNGEYKRVEDLETDDFRHSAHVSSDLKIDSSTVVHIEENEAQGTAVLGFVVGEHKIQVTVEATVEHPFFVFGQGWSSCEPTWTRKRYGLECHKLSVGDVCISLTHKEVTEHAAEISQQQKRENLEGTRVFEKDLKPESGLQVSRDSPGQGHSSRSPANSQSPTIQGQSLRSESGQYNESNTASVKGERLFGSPVSSQIPSSSQTQEQRSLPSTTS